MRRCLLAICALLAALSLAPAAASAAQGQFFPAQVIEGPSAEVVGDVDVALARDGTGAVVWVRRDGGVPHIFASRIVGGAWQAPERIDPFAGTASQPVVAAADGGKLVVAWISDGALVATVRQAAGQGWGAPQVIAAGARDPSIDLNVNDVAYVSATVGAGDVVVARKARGVAQFAGLAAPVDVDPAREAGTAGGRSRIVVAADGTALVVWGEAGHVFARRLIEDRLSQFPQDLSGPGPADLPDVAIEDDSSFAWVVFRQFGADGVPHGVGRRMRGTAFDPAVAIDGGVAEGIVEPRIAMASRGDGYAASASSASGAVFGAVIHDNVFWPANALGGAAPSVGTTAPATDDGGDGAIAYMGGDGVVRARYYENDAASRSPQAPQAEAVLGPGDPALGIEGAGDRNGDLAWGFTQTGPAGRSVVVATFDRTPGRAAFAPLGRYRNAAVNPIAWSRPFDLWGVVAFTVVVDGVPIAQTGDTRLALPGVPDGPHRVAIVTTDRRGQTSTSRTRTFLQDTVAPRARVSVSGARRRGRQIRVRVRPTDANPAGLRASGVDTVRVLWGDGSSSIGRTVRHAYRRAGRVTLTVQVADRAGNRGVVTRALRIR